MKFLKKRRIFVFVIFFFSFLSTASLSALAEWTVLVYVQAKNNLSKFAAKNLNEMAFVGSNHNVNILVQWYQLNQKGFWRYKVEKDKINLDSYSSADSDGSQVSDLVDSVRWAAKKSPSKKFILVLWGHGIGILDPRWGNMRYSNTLGISSDVLKGSFRMQNEELPKSFDINEQDLFANRGILFNDNSKTYMNNQKLVESLKQIKNNVLKKKIEILGMDACLMSMVEVAYQARDYASYMVSSQEVELATGWDYLTLVQGLASGGQITPAQVAQGIVIAYENYYKKRVQFYTQSAVALENMNYIKDSIDQIVTGLNECKKYDGDGIKVIIKNVRKDVLQFSTQSFIDLYSFYSILNNRLIERYKQSQNNVNLFQSVEKLKSYLSNGMKIIENSVIAKVSGRKFPGAKGLSIYFPRGNIDASYAKTEFAKNCLWLKFLKEYR